MRATSRPAERARFSGEGLARDVAKTLRPSRYTRFNPAPTTDHPWCPTGQRAERS